MIQPSLSSAQSVQDDELKSSNSFQTQSRKETTPLERPSNTPTSDLETIYSMLSTIMQNQTQLETKIDYVVRQLQKKETPSKEPPSAEESPFIPIKSIDEFKKFEEDLKDVEFEQKLVNFF